MTGAAGPREHDLDEAGDDAPAPADRVAAGSILGGKYRLISEIGRGGMGSVWRAEHLAWEAPVALKIMNRDITSRPEAVARFEREVRLAAGLRSPHVVQVLDHGLDEATRTPYIVMELLEGESLARRLKRLGVLSPAETFHVFSQLVRALIRAHAAGIVHRDLKPDNVFLVRNEEESLTKVLDFGVAKWTAPDISESGLTRPGSVVGTPYYMSPEQIQGSREIDHRADLWALAAIACECLTGRRPFEARDFAQLAVLLLGNQGRPSPSSLGAVPAGFDAWFFRATDPDISRRFQSAREMAQTLAPICDAVPSSLGSDAYAQTQPAPVTRYDVPSVASVSNSGSRLLMHPALWQRPMAKLAAVTVAVTLVVTGGAAFWLLGRAPRAAWVAPAAVAPAIAVPAPQPSSGPGIRPIRGGELSLPAASTGSAAPRDPSGNPRLSAHSGSFPVSPPDSANPDTLPIDPSETGTLPARPVNDDFDREATEKAVRAALLERLKAQKPKSNKHVKPTETRESDEAAGVAPRAEPATPAPADGSPSLVDGRRIRTSL